MMSKSSILLLLATVLLWTAGCASVPPTLHQEPVGQSELDQFLSGGRDARYYGITTYQGANGARFEFANRLHPDRGAERDFVRPRKLPVPILKARTATFVNFHLLLDSSARQNWLLMASVAAMDYRPFKPPIGEYADHVVAEIPGYAGRANKIVLDTLHVESPIFCVPPARGNLGPLARVVERPEDDSDPEAALARLKLGTRTHAVMGAALMRAFSYIRFDFPGRKIRFSSSSTYKPAASGAVYASVPMRDWKGRPAVEIDLDGQPLLAVIDTAGDFDVALPGDAADRAEVLSLGNMEFDDLLFESHADLGLPDPFPVRLGLGTLARFILTLDFKNQRVWFEYLATPSPEDESAPETDETEEPNEDPVQYRGIDR